MTQKIAGNQASFLGGMATGALPTTSCQTTLERYTGRYDLDTTNNNSDLHKKDKIFIIISIGNVFIY